MVGNQKRSGGSVADVSERSSEGGVGETTQLFWNAHRARSADGTRAGEREAWQIGPGGTVLTNMRTDPPPKHKDNYPAQRYDIGRENVAAAAERSNVSERSIESTSASARETTSASAGVGMGAHYPRRLRGHGRGRETARDVGRDAARDVGRAAGRQGDAERWLALLAPESLPPGVERTVNDSHSKWYRLRLATTPLTVILEIEVWQGELWAHLAITGRTAPPTLAELGWCRDLFLGDRKAIQVLPRKIEAAEAGARSVHLYVQLESDTLPSCSRTCHPSIREQG